MSDTNNNIVKETGGLLQKLAVAACLIIGPSAYAGGLIVQRKQAQEMAALMESWSYGQTVRPLSMNPFTNIVLGLTTPDGLKVVAVAVLIVLAVCLLAAMKKQDNANHDERNFNISDKGTYGTSGWMTRSEMSEVLQWRPTEQSTGTILGIIDNKAVSLPVDSRLNKHTAIYGASGTGKSRSFVRPQILQCVARGESVIITDPKGEIYADAAEYMKANGYNVKVFNLVDPVYSDSWNCLQEVMKGCFDEQGFLTEEGQTQISMNAQTFCDVIIKNTSNGKSDHFWDNSELSLLKALVLYVCCSERAQEEKTIGAVYSELTNNTMKDLESKFMVLDISHPAKAPWDIFQRAGDSVKGNVIIGLGTRLQVFQAKNIRDITGYDEIDLEMPARQKSGYFVIMSDQNSTLDFLSSLFFSFLFIDLVKYADVHGDGGKCDVPVNFILDEFPNIGQIPDFTKKLSTIRSRELRVAVIFQNIAQLQNRYPMGLWEEIIGNCDTQLFLGCTDQTTAKFISERTGEMTIEVNSTAVTKVSLAMTQHIPDYKETESVGKRYVLTPDEVMRLGAREALVLIRGQKVLKVGKFDYSLHPRCNDFIHGYVRDHVPDWRARQAIRNKMMLEGQMESTCDYEDEEEKDAQVYTLSLDQELPKAKRRSERRDMQEEHTETETVRPEKKRGPAKVGSRRPAKAAGGQKRKTSVEVLDKSAVKYQDTTADIWACDPGQVDGFL